MYKIIKKRKINETVEEMTIEAPYVARKCKPGQFVIIIVEEGGERVPLTIADYDREAKTVTIIYQMVGHSTKLLGTKNEGEYISDIAGPLGNPVEFHGVKRVLGIGGGVGAAPLFPQIKEIVRNGAEADVIIGGRSEAYIILDDKFSEFAQNVYVATNDGSKGIQGFVTDILNKLIAEGKEYDEVIAIGPVVMMKAVVDITKKLGIKTSVSLNPIMIDGTGMCGGCRVTIGNEVKFACVDGPDFDGFEVDFEELMRRQGMYKKEEEHKCRMGAGK
jgi:ferredoxin/flavodoxin---NADP+ reductase